jgi:hypothetical protein
MSIGTMHTRIGFREAVAVMAISAQRLEKVKLSIGRVDRAETRHIGVVLAL